MLAQARSTIAPLMLGRAWTVAATRLRAMLRVRLLRGPVVTQAEQQPAPTRKRLWKAGENAVLKLNLCGFVISVIEFALCCMYCVVLCREALCVPFHSGIHAICRNLSKMLPLIKTGGGGVALPGVQHNGLVGLAGFVEQLLQ